MSGGEYDYICHRIAEIQIKDKDINIKRATFQKLLYLVAEAMHDIEWVDSGDYSEGSENDAIEACLTFLQADPKKLYKANAYDLFKKQMENI